MIKVIKDYNDIPRSLISPKIEKNIQSILTQQSADAKIYKADNEVLDKLKHIYNNKCAYCETITDNPTIDEYRPRTHYYWLVYEWSNLVLSCKKCKTAKADNFPLSDEKKRISEPNIDRTQWRADSKIARDEMPILLMPEIDVPDEHLAFYPDGRCYPLTERGKINIEILKLNNNTFVTARTKILNDLIIKLTQQLTYTAKILTKKNTETEAILTLAFQPIYTELIQKTKPEAEFSLFVKNLLSNFNKFVIEQFDNDMYKNILKQSFYILLQPLLEEMDTMKSTNSNINNDPILTQENIDNKVTITNIQIKNIKCFENTTIKFENQNTVLLGINGRGKTTVLQLIALAILQIQRPTFEREWKNIKKNRSKKAEFTIDIIAKKKKIKLNYEITDNDNIIFVGKPENLKSIADIFLVAYGTGRNAEFHNFRLDENYRNLATLFGINSLYSQSSEIEDYLKQGNAFLQIKKIITNIFNYAEEMYNRIELANYDNNLKTFMFKTPTNKDTEIPLSALSSGFRTSFLWILDLVIRIWKKNFDLDKPHLIYGIVMIDEIDTHLHIKWQRNIIYTLQEIFKNIQFIVTTHSPFIVQSFGNKNIISLKLDNDTIQAETINIEEAASYEAIIKELFDQTAIFDVKIERKLDLFYEYLKQIRSKKKTINDSEFKNIVADLKSKGEELNTIIALEIKQLKSELDKKN